MTEPTVTQEDREAAAFIVYEEMRGSQNWPAAKTTRDRIKTGGWDGHYIVQAFARHRHAAEQRALAEGVALGIEAAKLALKTANGINKAALWDVNHVLGTLDPAAIIAQHMRTKATCTSSRIADSDGDDGA
jgi:hypothetical protein